MTDYTLDGRTYRAQRIKSLLKERDECLLVVQNPEYKLTNNREVKARVRHAWTRLAEIRQELKDYDAE